MHTDNGGLVKGGKGGKLTTQGRQKGPWQHNAPSRENGRAIGSTTDHGGQEEGAMGMYQGHVGQWDRGRGSKLTREGRGHGSRMDLRREEGGGRYMDNRGQGEWGSDCGWGSKLTRESRRQGP